MKAPHSSVGTPPADKPLLAYSVHNDEHGTIVFARHAVTARRVGVNELDDEFDYVTCRRSPWADAFAATGAVPASLAIEHGWQFECHHCGRGLSDHMADDVVYDAEPDDTQEEVDARVAALPDVKAIIGAVTGAVYCRQACVDAHAEEKRRRVEVVDEMKVILRAQVRDRFGDAVAFVDTPRALSDGYANVYDGGVYLVAKAQVSFEFPGQTLAPASLEYREQDYRKIGPSRPGYWITKGDEASWEAFAATHSGSN